MIIRFFILVGFLTILTVGAFYGPFLISTAASNQKATEVDQVTDPTAGHVLDMFRFEPDFVHLPVGAEVIFNNSRGQHTVNSISGLIPDGVEEISIANTSTSTRTLDVPGIYVLTCKIHGRYGMVMMIAIGEPETWTNPPETWTKKLTNHPGKKLDLLLARLKDEVG